MPFSIALTRSRATGFSTTPNRPDAPVKSRFHRSWPARAGSAGYSTSSTSGPRAQPRRHRQRVLLVARHPHRERAQAAQAEEAVVGGRRDTHVGPQAVQRADASPRSRRSRPSSTSECPPMYFVAACTDTSTPWSNARKPSGVAHVLSRMTCAPCAWATRAIAGTSCTSNVSEPGDSVNTMPRVGPELTRDVGARAAGRSS